MQNETKRTWQHDQAYNKCIIGIPEREEREKGAEYLFEEITAEETEGRKKKSRFRRYRDP